MVVLSRHLRLKKMDMKYRLYYTPRKTNKVYASACKVYVERHDLKKKSRHFDYVIQRQVLAYLMAKKGCSHYSIGEVIGLNHSTCTYSIKKIKTYIETNFTDAIEAIKCIGAEVEEIIKETKG